MEVAAYMPYQHRAFQSGYNPHYAQYHDPRAQTSHPISAEPSMTAHYGVESVRRSDRTANAITQNSHISDEANKPSLPSISNLLGIADGERTSVPNQDNCL